MVIAGGHRRAVEANEPILRKRLERRCRLILHGKPSWQQRVIRRRMEAILDRLLERVAPPHALY